VQSRGLSLDSGALIAIERGDRGLRRILDQSIALSDQIHVVAGVLAQVWRGGSGQARLASFLRLPQVTIAPLDEHVAVAVGQLCGLTGHADVVDVHVVLHARSRGHTVVTSDPDDLRRVDRRIPLITV
jgi:predicted nucleic acid-binding protein